MSIEEELWCIFTNYTLMSNPTEPATLTSQQFLKLAKETQLVRGANGVAAAQIAIAAQLAAGESMQRHGRKGVALTFRDFMEVLARLAPGCRRIAATGFAFTAIAAMWSCNVCEREIARKGGREGEGERERERRERGRMHAVSAPREQANG